jgi:hypothetical protein
MNLTVFLAFLVGFVAANSVRKFASHNSVVPEQSRMAKLAALQSARPYDVYLYPKPVRRAVPWNIRKLKLRRNMNKLMKEL